MRFPIFEDDAAGLLNGNLTITLVMLGLVPPLKYPSVSLSCPAILLRPTGALDISPMSVARLNGLLKGKRSIDRRLNVGAGADCTLPPLENPLTSLLFPAAPDLGSLSDPTVVDELKGELKGNLSILFDIREGEDTGTPVFEPPVLNPSVSLLLPVRAALACDSVPIVVDTSGGAANGKRSIRVLVEGGVGSQPDTNPSV